MLGFVGKFIDDVLFAFTNILTYKENKIGASLVRVLNTFVFFYVVSGLLSNNTLKAIVLISIASGLGRYTSFIIDDKLSKDDTWLTIVKYKGEKIDLQHAIDGLMLNRIDVFSVPANYNNKGGESLMLIIINKDRKASQLVKTLMPSGVNISSIPIKEYI